MRLKLIDCGSLGRALVLLKGQTARVYRVVVHSGNGTLRTEKADEVLHRAAVKVLNRS